MSPAASAASFSNCSGFGKRTATDASIGIPHSARGVPRARVKIPLAVTHGAEGQIYAPSETSLENLIPA